jgi:hypothetical protein
MNRAVRFLYERAARLAAMHLLLRRRRTGLYNAPCGPGMEAAEKKIAVLSLGLFFAAVHITGLAGAMGPNFLDGRNDFAAFYLGAKLSGSGHLYDAHLYHAGQQREFGYSMPAVTYIRLPFYAALLKPISWLDYGAAWRLFLLANTACAVWFYWKFLRDDTLAFLLGAAFLPTYAALANGQDVWFPAALFGLSVLLLRLGCDFLAGLALSLCTIKPHLFVFVPLVLLLHGKWRTLAGGAAGAVGLFALSTIAEGGQWIGQWLDTIRNPVVHPRPEIMPTLRGLAFLAGAPPWALWMLAALTTAAVILVARRSRHIETGLAAALAGSLAVSYHAYLADTVLLLVAFALLRRHSLTGAPLWLWVLLVSPLPALLFVFGPPWALVLPLATLGALAGLLFWHEGSPEAGREPVGQG